MEAQYALQKKKPLVPLMLTQGYEADGWLGLMLGTSMWYAFHGETLSSESSFESRVDALCREIGSRGRADATVALQAMHQADAQLESKLESVELGSSGLLSDHGDADAVTLLRKDLSSLRVRDLLRRARDEAVCEEAVLDAQDGDDVRGALTELIVQALSVSLQRDQQQDEAAREELASLRVRELMARARALDLDDAVLDAQDSDDPKGALVNLLLRHHAPQ
jgi:hypothetical protein